MKTEAVLLSDPSCLTSRRPERRRWQIASLFEASHSVMALPSGPPQRVVNVSAGL